MTTLHWEWPRPGPCDLARAFEALSGGVQRLEGALVAGRVEQELEVEEVRFAVGPLIAETYAVLVRRNSAPYVGERRRATIKRLLDETRAELVRLERTFPAEFTPGAIDPERGLDAHAKLQITGDPPAVLRLDQAIAARFWGVGFHFERAEDGDLLARAILRDAARGLATDLSDLDRILARIRGDERFPPLVPPLEIRAFERLMLDLLNEHRPAAVKAPLEQDYSQKTDLRYDTVRGLGRQRGARVQVTSLTDFALHQTKLDLIENRDKFVLLSPIELALWVDAEVHGRGPFHVPLDRELLARLWSAIGAQADVRELVSALGRVFQRAQRTAPESPLGPLAHVPAPVRELVRLWVDRSALRSTRLLRAFEDRFGQDSARGDGRMLRRWATPPSTTEEQWSASSLALRPGAHVLTRIERASRAGLWARCDAVEVFVLTRRPREEWPATGTELEVVLLDASAERHWYTGALPDEDPDMVVHGARPAPYERPARPAPDPAEEAAWTGPAASALASGARLRGRILRRKSFGLVVELVPGVAGLLHELNMGGRKAEEFEEGAELEVALARVDLAGRRIDLVL